LFKVFGIQLAVHASFLLLLAYQGWVGWADSGWTGMLVEMLFIVLFFTCVVMHELGHSLTAMRFGVRVPRILLMPIGGMAEFDHIPRQPRAEFLITAAGPMVNFVIVGLLYAIFGVPKGWPSWNAEYADNWTGLAQVLLTWNFYMGCFNLLPVFPMDGGRILRAVLAARMPYLRATYWAAISGKVLASAAALIAAFYLHRPMLVLLFVFIFLAADAEYRALLRREQEAAYWAEMARRLAVVPAAEPEALPPRITDTYHGPN
jgi:Zn-dependent protease